MTSVDRPHFKVDSGFVMSDLISNFNKKEGKRMSEDAVISAVLILGVSFSSILAAMGILYFIVRKFK